MNGQMIFSPSCPKDLKAKMSKGVEYLSSLLNMQELYKGKDVEVFLVMDPSDRSKYVKKHTFKDKLTELRVAQCRREIQLQGSLEHPHIVPIHMGVETDDAFIIMMDYFEGGDLFEDVLGPHGKRLPEKDAVSTIIKPLLDALQFLHSRDIMHRDIKLENLLRGPDGRIMLSDFGFAINCRDERPVTRLGTFGYMSREVLKAFVKRNPDEYKDRVDVTYGPEADVFAVGVLSYEVLCGMSPFDAQDLNGMLGQIEKGPRYPDHLSDAAVGFLRQCLYADAGKRADIKALLRHPLISKHVGPTRAQTARVRIDDHSMGGDSPAVSDNGSGSGAAAPAPHNHGHGHGHGHGHSLLLKPGLAHSKSVPGQMFNMEDEGEGAGRESPVPGHDPHPSDSTFKSTPGQTALAPAGSFTPAPGSPVPKRLPSPTPALSPGGGSGQLRLPSLATPGKSLGLPADPPPKGSSIASQPTPTEKGGKILDGIGKVFARLSTATGRGDEAPPAAPSKPTAVPTPLQILKGGGAKPPAEPKVELSATSEGRALKPLGVSPPSNPLLAAVSGGRPQSTAGQATALRPLDSPTPSPMSSSIFKDPAAPRTSNPGAKPAAAVAPRGVKFAAGTPAATEKAAPGKTLEPARSTKSFSSATSTIAAARASLLQSLAGPAAPAARADATSASGSLSRSGSVHRLAQS